MQIEPSSPFGDGPCPNCGTLLLFVQVGRHALFVTGEEAEAIRERIRTFSQDDEEIREETIRQLQSILARHDANSLDLVELVMEIEDFDSTC
ncbi:MAG TPA: hypothetical protein VGY55_22750 [Pirellulales bacterium]|nr:hypothetical protein [Pirellulales bacterium]